MLFTPSPEAPDAVWMTTAGISVSAIARLESHLLPSMFEVPGTADRLLRQRHGLVALCCNGRADPRWERYQHQERPKERSSVEMITHHHAEALFRWRPAELPERRQRVGEGS